MLNTTLSLLRCPCCAGELALHPVRKEPVGPQAPEVFEVSSGHLRCEGCPGRYPVLGGVAVLVPDVRSYLLHHVKGISQAVADEEIPKAFRREYLAAKAEIESEHIEEDLEAERVISLYLANHYLRADPAAAGSEPGWWKPRHASADPLMDRLIREHWDQGPLARIEAWMTAGEGVSGLVIELGCGVAGLSRRLRSPARSYLGVDSSFASIALGRHLALGVPYAKPVRVPGDLLEGPVSREVRVPPAPSIDGSTDLVVGEIEALPVARGRFDAALALNAIDMLPEPALLPALQGELLRPGGVAIQSGPYIWHEIVARALRAELPKGVRDSASAVEWLYERAGLRIEERLDHVPWLFFKHVRQLEIYSVHLLRARKAE